MRSELLRFAPTLLGVTAMLVTRVLFAAETPTDPERARALFKEGRRLAADGKYPEACAQFEESLRLDAGIGTEFNLADCWEHAGRTASAHTLFTRVTEAATQAGQTERAAVARSRVAALEPKLARLLIRVDSPSPSLELFRNGKPIGVPIAQPFAVDPGAQAIEARSPGQRSWSVHLDVPATAGTVTVIIPKLEDQEEKPRVTPIAAGPVAEDPKRMAEARAQPPHAVAADLVTGPEVVAEGDSTLRKATLVFGGVGLAALVAGGWMMLDYRSSNQAASTICPSSRGCTGAQINDHALLVDDARSARSWAYVSLGAGAAALIGATVAYLRERRDAVSTIDSGVATAPVVTAESVGLALSGRW